ncbi:N-acetylmuramate alpha-1-phosphate uridylyltransferase MurU [Thioalkalivibrio sp.]|uniref:N-acetylmuramate alpha-1-phosphate uridylyltransferase MurU n=1 Tax=Thioalkalivibrio sp. TaxID=2093813 RepID=UPI00397483C5
MRAMILAAGRGERMRPLTDRTPKPLLTVGGVPLIGHSIRRLREAGYRDLVINTAHLGEQIEARLGDGGALGVRIRYSREPPGALETAGGIREALDLLGSDPFLVINADIWCDHPLRPPTLAAEALAHLVLVANPEHHPQGDFTLRDGLVGLAGGPRHTFAGIGWYRPDLFAGLPRGRRALGPLLREAVTSGRVTGELHRGHWIDVGTPERLRLLDQKETRQGRVNAQQSTLAKRVGGETDQGLM